MGWRWILLLWAGVVLFPTPGATQELPAIDGKYTQRLISDRVFTGGFGMRTQEIQQFLDKKGTECDKDDDLCLKNYQDPATGESAAEIIRRLSRQHAINPKVILVTLQKENSLVTETSPEPWQYRTAMGYGCPDGADCEAEYYGFANQVKLGTQLLRAGYDRACGDYLSAWQWRVNPQRSKGNVITIDGRPTHIQNCATAALYNYTPHRVDSAWRPYNDRYFYGNYNFVTYMQKWFGAN
ncbi:hypothetical protein BRC19_00830 [Candidatus Saccharibacteria bacterium QS_5_54_17]|nr:MAG: hypothetical protein BRC19_00830 [Candidatus Saccharibacteria bacterium QS_5_54_17]